MAARPLRDHPEIRGWQIDHPRTTGRQTRVETTPDQVLDDFLLLIGSSLMAESFPFDLSQKSGRREALTEHPPIRTAARPSAVQARAA